MTPRTLIRDTADLLVYRGEDGDTRKRFTAFEALTPAGRQTLADRAKFLKPFDHPAVLKLLDAAPQRLLFADAQCSLRQYLDWAGPLPPADAAHVLLQLAAGLAHLHGKKAGHGCVGPHTAVVTADGGVAFADFVGYPLYRGPLPTPDPLPHYLAPELLTMPAAPGPAADLYALGYLGLEMLAGPRFRSLFDLPEGADPLMWHADRNRPLANWRAALSHVPKGLLDWLGGLIPKPAGERKPETAAAAHDALAAGGFACERRLPAYFSG